MNDKLKNEVDELKKKNEFLFYLRNLYRERKFKTIYQLFNRPFWRPYSRKIITKFCSHGYGVEIGVGDKTIAPTKRTVLSDAFETHGVKNSIADAFFSGDDIPVPTESFSFVLSEHMLEHVTNPIKFLKEWIRVLQKGGHLLLFLPHKERTNDRYRQTTSLDHLIYDYDRNPTFDDPEHLEEWWQNVVEKGLMPNHYKHLPKDDLLKTASIHQHVWTEKEIEELFEYLGLEVVHKEVQVPDRRDSFLVVGKKVL